MRIGLGLGLTRPRGSSAWSPAALPGISFWAEADPTRQFQDTAQTTPADGNGELVRRILARYPAGLALDAPSDAARPAYSTAGLDGAKALSFEASADNLRSVTHAGVTGAQTVCLRYKNVSGGRLYSSVDAAGGGCQIRVASPQIVAKFGATASPTATVIGTKAGMTTDASTLTVLWDGVSSTDASSYTIRFNGEVLPKSAGGGITNGSGTAQTTLGADNATTPAGQYTGFLALVIVCAGVLAGDDLTAIEAYANDWT